MRNLATLGRGNDNARYGGQVAHISADEANLLRRRGGAGTINPLTGLPEYMTGTAGAVGGMPNFGAIRPMPGSVEHYQRYGTWSSDRGEPTAMAAPGSQGYYAKYGTWGDVTSPNDPSKNPHLKGSTYNPPKVVEAPADTRTFGAPINVNTLYQSNLAGLLNALTRGQTAAQQNPPPTSGEFSPAIAAIRQNFFGSF